MNDEPDALSPTATNGRTVNRDSMVQRVADRLNSPNGDVKKSKSRRSRRASTSSAISQGQAVSTVVKSGLQVAVPGGEEVPKAGRVVSVGRSPYLLTQDSDSDDNDDSGDESDHVSDVEAHLPVTGFAVASNRRNAEFHGMFPTVDGGDYLIEGDTR
jgi:hypothetical protein